MTGGSDERTARGTQPAPRPHGPTALPLLSNSGRQCAHCRGGMEGRPVDAVYCCLLCRERASKVRRDAREDVTQIRVQQRRCKSCLVPVGKGKQLCAVCREQRRQASKRAADERARLARPPQPSRMKRVISRPVPEVWDVPSGTAGAMCELLVACDLLKRGYHVFRAVSPSCPCDLLVMREGLSARVEVRKVTRRIDGGFPTGVGNTKERSRFDVLARVESNGTIHYTGLEKLHG